MPCRSPGPHPGGNLRGLAWGGSPGPRPGGKLRSLAWGVSRPTPRGEVRPTPGGHLQAHTRGGGKLRGLALGGLQAHTHRGSPGPHPGGSPGPHLGGVSRLTPGGASQHALRQTPPPRWLLLRAVCILLECIFVQTECRRELDWDHCNAKVWAQIQVQFKLQCKNFHVILWKPILFQSWSRTDGRLDGPYRNGRS